VQRSRSLSPKGLRDDIFRLLRRIGYIVLANTVHGETTARSLLPTRALIAPQHAKRVLGTPLELRALLASQSAQKRRGLGALLLTALGMTIRVRPPHSTAHYFKKRSKPTLGLAAAEFVRNDKGMAAAFGSYDDAGAGRMHISTGDGQSRPRIEDDAFIQDSLEDVDQAGILRVGV
jgi:hypothetical protein